jgi:hypothetical protein
MPHLAYFCGPPREGRGEVQWVLRSALTALFDNLVGEVEHRRRHSEAERPGGLEIDH